MEDLGAKERLGWGIMRMKLKGEKPIRGVEWSMGLTSPPYLDTRGIEARLRSGESIL